MVNQYCAHSFARNWQLPFLNQRKGENDRRKYFIINLHVRMLQTSAEVEPATSWSPVGRAAKWATEASSSNLGLHCLPSTLLRVCRLQWVKIYKELLTFCTMVTRIDIRVLHIILVWRTFEQNLKKKKSFNWWRKYGADTKRKRTDVTTQYDPYITLGI